MIRTNQDITYQGLRQIDRENSGKNWWTQYTRNSLQIFIESAINEVDIGSFTKLVIT